VLDEHLHAPWKPGGSMATGYRRRTRVDRGEPNWRVVRYADDCAPRALTEVAM
jgi:RNA-directed DNA polymerase